MLNLAVVDLVTLQLWQSQALANYAAMQSGGKVASLSYSQGDGSRSVTYTASSIETLRPWLAALAAEIARRTGVCAPRRRAIGLRY